MLLLPLSLQLLLFSLSLLLWCKSFVSRFCVQTRSSIPGVIAAVCMYCVVCRLLLSLLLSSARLDLLLMCLVAYSLVDRSVGSFASWLVAFFVVSWSRLLKLLFGGWCSVLQVDIFEGIGCKNHMVMMCLSMQTPHL